LCAAVVALSASAAPAELARRAEKKQVPAEFKVSARQVGQSLFTTPTVKRSLAGTPVTGIANVQCELYRGAWYLDAFDASKNFKAEFAFVNGKSDQIAGNYEAKRDSTRAMVVVVAAAGDTVPVFGNFSISYLSAGTNYPEYRIVASNLVDSLGRAFDFDFSAEVHAIDYEKYYYSQTYPDYCGLYFDCDYEIELDDAPVVITGDTIRHTVAGIADFADYTAGDEYGDKWFQFLGTDADYSVSLCVIADHVIGTFAVEDLDMEYTGAYAITNGQGTLIKIDSVFAPVVAQRGDTIVADFGFLGRDGVVYEFTLKYYTPSVVSEKTIDLWGMVLNDYYYEQYGEIELSAANATDTVVLTIYPSQSLVGQYTDKDLSKSYSRIKSGSAEYVIFSATFSIAENGDVLVLSGDFLTKQGVLIHLTMHTGWPEAIENTEAAVKAAKKFENGVLLIEKNGVKYNAQGAILK
jgi:hypothetical protein